MKRNNVIISGLFLFFLSSCSPKIPFTQAVRDQYQLTPEELKGIQFYLSDPLALRRGETNDNQKSTEEGKLIVQSGRTIDQVTIKSNTPGAVELVADNKTLKVAFEEGAEKSLVFSSENNRNGYYSLRALKWINDKGEVNYGGQTYYSNQGSGQCVLLFKMKSVRKLRINEKVAKGRKVN
ncbi:MAG: hypothetical protein IPO63_12830 [Bacteroidetes bacterium]|nr:hypothetical protein [Bacteroidota bacterium]